MALQPPVTLEVLHERTIDLQRQLDHFVEELRDIRRLLWGLVGTTLLGPLLAIAIQKALGG